MRFRTTYLAIPLFLLLALLPVAGHAAGFGLPSNPAGVIETEFTPGTHLMSFPVLPAGATVNGILADHFPAGEEWVTATRIVTVENGDVLGSYYSSIESAWLGTLDELQVKRSYWLIIPDGSQPVEMRLIGGALTMAETVIDTLHPGVNMIACPAVVPVTLAGSGLTDSGYRSAQYAALADRVFTYTGGLVTPTWRHPTEGWQGTEFTFHPGKGYLFEIAHGDQDILWTRPELIVGAEPPRGGFEATVPSGMRHMLQAPSIDFDSAPWSTSAGTSARNSGGGR
ncbi:hypothetical protein KQI52_09735 [bacterium]|nr:hypothetical protein [bacterium]